jgi:hypothetical protein
MCMELVWGLERTGPSWAARMFAPASGQDHLGLGSVSSDRILPLLSPGINVLTVHPRYWSFYLFVLDEFWLRDLPRNRAAFRDFYRPREALFAMACNLCDAEEHATLGRNIVGSQKIAPLTKQDQFDPGYDYIKEALGGYSLYYRSTMEATGTIVTPSPRNGFVFDAPTPSGRAIADAYRRAISETAVWRNYLGGPLDEPIVRDVLIEFARRGCLCQLATASDYDRPLLQDLFAHSGSPDESVARRGTFRLLLDVSATLQPEGLTEDVFRQLIYFRTLEGEVYQPRSDLLDVARRWRLFQAREYFSFAFNRLFGWLVRRGQRESDDGLVNLPIGQVLSWIDEALNENTFGSGELGSFDASTRVSEFANALASQVDLDAGVDDAWPRHGTLDEHELYCRHPTRLDSPGTVVAMIALLLLINRRIGSASRIADIRNDERLVTEGATTRIGMARFFTELNRRVMAGATLSSLARWIIHDHVIVQHERVANAKLPDDTFRLNRVGDSIRFSTQAAPADFNDSRYTALSATIHELGLVSSLHRPSRHLTQEGRTLLETGDVPTGLLATAATPYLPVSGDPS